MAAGLLAMFVLTACASGKSIKQGAEEFSIPADKYYEALQLQDDAKYFEAIRAWSEVLVDEPRFAQGHFNIGLIYDNLNMVPEAIEHYELAVQAAEDSRDLIGGDNPAAEDGGNITASIALYNLHLGAAYLRGGLVDEAIDALKKSIKDDQFNPTAHYNIAAGYMALNDFESALVHADVAVDLVSKPDSKRASGIAAEVDMKQLGNYLLRQARCHLARQEWDKARSCLERAKTQCKLDIPVDMQKQLDEAAAAKPAEAGE
ncbi:MAG: tetratricopeptide repeat protein [Planctomycetota bacterium]|nr:tetratricopeptide repeat protein [Planctomycetota bacterium]